MGNHMHFSKANHLKKKIKTKTLVQLPTSSLLLALVVVLLFCLSFPAYSQSYGNRTSIGISLDQFLLDMHIIEVKHGNDLFGLEINMGYIGLGPYQSIGLEFKPFEYRNFNLLLGSGLWATDRGLQSGNLTLAKLAKNLFLPKWCFYGNYWKLGGSIEMTDNFKLNAETLVYSVSSRNMPQFFWYDDNEPKAIGFVLSIIYTF